MRVRYLAKQQQKRDKQKPVPPLVRAHITVASSPTGIRLTLRTVAVSAPTPCPPDDVDVIAGAVARMFGGSAASSAKSKQTVKPAEEHEPFALVSECGWASLGVGRYSVAHFRSESEARAAASMLWNNWVVFQKGDSSYTELASGGVGFARYAVRNYAQQLAVAEREARGASSTEPPQASELAQAAELAPKGAEAGRI